MSNRVYDVLSKVQRWLPALGVFYLTLAQIWGLPFGDQVNETIVAVAVLLATTLEISSVAYHKKKEEQSCYMEKNQLIMA